MAKPNDFDQEAFSAKLIREIVNQFLDGVGMQEIRAIISQKFNTVPKEHQRETATKLREKLERFKQFGDGVFSEVIYVTSQVM